MMIEFGVLHFGPTDLGPGELLTSYGINLAALEMVQDLAPFAHRALRPDLGIGFAEVDRMGPRPRPCRLRCMGQELVIVVH